MHSRMCVEMCVVLDVMPGVITVSGSGTTLDSSGFCQSLLAFALRGVFFR